jgi:lipocalin
MIKITYTNTSFAVAALFLAFGANAEETAHFRQRKLQFDDEPVPESLPELPNELCWVPFFTCEADNCEKVSPLGADAFNLTKYIEKSWFIQKQQVTPYQSEDQLYCVVATYNTRDDGFLQVQNTGNTGGVDGEPQNSDSDSFLSSLCAKQVKGGSLQVAPCLFKPVFSLIGGPYWILAVGEEGESYSWAIVSGGPPNKLKETVDGRNFCTTKEGTSFLDINGSGLWLFTKAQTASNATIAAMEEKLTEMGIYTGDLKPVEQEGCVYPDSTKF